MLAIWISCPTKDNADTIARELVTQKLLQFAQIFPVDSIYMWEGKVQPDHQFIIFGELKDTDKEMAETAIRKLHQDKIPCWSFFPVEINRESKVWMEQN